MSFKPTAQAVKSGEEYAFCDVALIKFVSRFFLDVVRNYHLSTNVRVGSKPVIQSDSRIRHCRKQRKLVYDAIIHRRRLEKDKKRITLLHSVELVKTRGRLGEHFSG